MSRINTARAIEKRLARDNGTNFVWDPDPTVESVGYLLKLKLRGRRSELRFSQHDMKHYPHWIDQAIVHEDKAADRLPNDTRYVV